MAPRNHSSGSESDSDLGLTKQRSSNRTGKVEEYRVKRDRNNVAVRKSREKSRQKARETMEKVNRLKKENEDLEMKVKLLSKELNLLKDLFLSHAGRDSFAHFATQTLVKKTEIKTENFMDSTGESDNSVDPLDGSSDGEYSMIPVAGIPACLEIIQRDHEYSAPTSRVK
jgi:CCAAT/enhancer binding protein (C/EBP) gamma